MKHTGILAAGLLLVGCIAAVEAKEESKDESSAEKKGKKVLKVGDAAPEFKLKGTDGKTYKLSDFKGKSAVIVAWYPKALTGG